MNNNAAPLFTEADMRALAAKLKGLHPLLSPGEQALLHELLRRAAGGRETPGTDAIGFAWAIDFDPFPYLAVVGADLQTGSLREDHDGGR